MPSFYSLAQRASQIQNANPSYQTQDIVNALNNTTWVSKNNGPVYLTESTVLSILGNLGQDGNAVLHRFETAANDPNYTSSNPTAVGAGFTQDALQRFVRLMQSSANQAHINDAVTRQDILAFSQVPIQVPSLGEASGVPMLTSAQANALVGLAWNQTSDALNIMGRPVTSGDLTTATSVQNFLAQCDQKSAALSEFNANNSQQILNLRAQADSTGTIGTLPSLATNAASAFNGM